MPFNFFTNKRDEETDEKNTPSYWAVSNPTNVKEITHAPAALNLYKQKKLNLPALNQSEIAIERAKTAEEY